MSELKPIRLLNTAELEDRVKYTRVHIWRLEQRNLFGGRPSLVYHHRVSKADNEIEAIRFVFTIYFKNLVSSRKRPSNIRKTQYKDKNNQRYQVAHHGHSTSE
jgi:hypothetical protein